MNNHYQVFLVLDQLNNLVTFTNINQATIVPVKKDDKTTNAVKVDDEYCEEFVEAIHAKGWTHRIVPPIK